MRPVVVIIMKSSDPHMGVSLSSGYLFGVPQIRIVVHWGLYWAPPVFGNYHIDFRFAATLLNGSRDNENVGKWHLQGT